MSHVALLFLLHTTASAQEAPPTASVVQKIPAEALGTLLKEPSGKVRVVNFWATWCGPCIAELPTLRDWAASHPEAEVVLVNVDLPSLHTKKVEPFVQRNGLQGLKNVQLDHPDPAMGLLATVPQWPESIPVTLVIDAKGKTVRQHTVAISAAILDEGLKAASNP